jgi:uncharacterized protein
MYSPAGLHLPSAPGWAHILLYATIVNALLIVFANVWVRTIGMGPMEWLLRSLSYWKRQPWKAGLPDRQAGDGARQGPFV